MKNYKYLYMRQAVFIAAFLAVICTSVMASNTATMCLDNSTAQKNVSLYNASDMTTFVSLTQNITCSQNCSTTLNDCRMEEPNQMYYFLAIIVISFGILMFSLWIGRRMPLIDMPIYFIMVLFFAMLGGVFDVFNSYYNTIFIAFTLIPIGFFLYSLYDNIRTGKRNKEDKRATGR